MTIRRRILKRTSTIERISVIPNQHFEVSEKTESEKFRVEIFNERGEKIYVCELYGKLEVEELPNGEVRILGGEKRLEL